MEAPEFDAVNGSLKKRSSGGSNTGILYGLRRAFFNLLRPPQPALSPSKVVHQRKNMTLPRMPQADVDADAQILVTERLLSPVSNTSLRQFHICSAYTQTPESVRTEFIELDRLSGGGGGEVLPHDATTQGNGHAFCAIPLELDTFCDHCNQPIWGLGWGPVCQRCADCHMTCHWLCKDKVSIPCESSPPPARTALGDSSGDSEGENVTHSRKATPPTPHQNILRSATQNGASRALSLSVDSSEEDQRLVDDDRQRWPTVDVSAAADGPLTQALPLAKGDGRRLQDPNDSVTPSSRTMRPASQFSLFASSFTDRSLDLGQVSEEPSPPPQGAVEDSGNFRTARHQSMLQPRRRHRTRQLSEVSNRRHTTNGLSLNSTTAVYDISSLDQRDIIQRGISVWHLSPTATKQKPPTVEPIVMSTRMQATQTAAATGCQTGCEEITYAKVTIGPLKAALPWKPMELARRLDIFNGNEFGLTAKMIPSLPPGDCEGQVRVHINLIRPIRMLLTSRPPSIFDIVNNDADLGSSSDEEKEDVCVPSEIPPPGPVRLRNKVPPQVSSFRLPRGSSKLLHVRLSTTASQVISNLLARFNIDDNPQKFALYEHTIIGEHEVSVRKLFDDESPLGLLLRWTLDQSADSGGEAALELHRDHFNRVLAIKRIVLQENETGDIEWTCFSEAELRTFLGILNREEADYRRRIEMKYQIRKREILRLMNLRSMCHRRANGNAQSGTCVSKNGTLTKAFPGVEPSSHNSVIGDDVRVSSDGDGSPGVATNSTTTSTPDLSAPASVEVRPALSSSQTELVAKAHRSKKRRLKSKKKLKKSGLMSATAGDKEITSKSPKAKSPRWLKKKK
ncbi:unnamed protein product [Mesocestoides corti]|uniref:Ras-associating domain-containing protein n=1 Tax=Mesocestoides corti TaxID=53468 RepID=A0A0R3U579_MESCO|nr:unnamed protein product [Mesocestoides corti]